MKNAPTRGTANQSWSERIVAVLARWRVTLGFAFAVMVLWLAQPTRDSLLAGGVVAALGEALRIWAAGHVEKSREVTRSGPYRLTRHPLYLGSCVIGAGIVIASASWIVTALVFSYLTLTLSAAVRAEEAHLRAKFGGEYDLYAGNLAPPMMRTFSLARALANREHHALAGLVVAFALLALKVGLSIR